MAVIDKAALDQLFLTARSHNGFKAETLPAQTWRDLYEVVKYGPTSMNCAPAKFLFLTSDAAKQRLLPHLAEGNKPKSLAAPAVVIVGYDTGFTTKMDDRFPGKPQVTGMFKDAPAGKFDVMAFRNGNLQGAYLIMAARALGLDTGPMSGFNNAGVDAEFFAGTTVKSDFICAIGHADDTLGPRGPRPSFEEACEIL